MWRRVANYYRGRGAATVWGLGALFRVQALQVLLRVGHRGFGRPDCAGVAGARRWPVRGLEQRGRSIVRVCALVHAEPQVDLAHGGDGRCLAAGGAVLGSDVAQSCRVDRSGPLARRSMGQSRRGEQQTRVGTLSSLAGGSQNRGELRADGLEWHRVDRQRAHARRWFVGHNKSPKSECLNQTQFEEHEGCLRASLNQAHLKE